MEITTLTLANYKDYIIRSKNLWQDTVDIIRESIVCYHLDSRFVEADTRLLSLFPCCQPLSTLDHDSLSQKDGYTGLGPLAMKEDDAVVFPFGGIVPYILRPDGDTYAVIGECVVHVYCLAKSFTDLQEKGGLEPRTQRFRLR